MLGARAFNAMEWLQRLRERGSGRLVHPATAALSVYACAWLYLAGVQFLTAHLPETDSYFHIKAALMLREEGVTRDFRWASFSLWSDGWFNKDFGFHVLLVPFTGGDLALGGKLAAVTYGAAVYASFFAVLALRRVRWAWLWTVALVAAGGYFSWRTNVARPQLVSIALSLWAIWLVLERRPRALFVVSALYALSYTAPIVAVGYAVIFTLASGAAGHGWPWRLPAASAAGVLFGWLVHPSFPYNFHGAWVQLAGVLGSAWGGSTPDLGLGGELRPADTWSFFREHLALVIAAAGAVVMLPYLSRRLDHRHATLFAIAGAYFVMACASKRFVEYFVPVTSWLCAEIWDRWLAGAGTPRLRRAVQVAAVVVLAIVLVRSDRETRRNFRRPHASGVVAAATWLAKNTARDTQVFTCDWDDAPELFFFNHHNRYMVFLDPMYLYGWSPELWRSWHDTANGKSADPVGVITSTFAARYGYCSHNFRALRRKLEADARARIVVEDEAGFVFALEP